MSELLEISFRLKLLTDTTMTGEGDAPGADIHIHRDPADRLPVLRGTTMAGALRHRLRRHLGLAPTDPDTREVLALFGSQEAKSALRTAIAKPMKDPEEFNKLGVRARIRRDPEKFTVVPGGLFTTEVVPGGTTFQQRWTLHLPQEPEERTTLLALLSAAAAGLVPQRDDQGARIRLGVAAGKGRGMLATSSWQVRFFDPSSPEGFDAYYGTTRAQRMKAALRNPTTYTTLTQALNDPTLPAWARPGAPLEEKEKWLRITGRLALAEPAHMGETTDPYTTEGTGPGPFWPGTLRHGDGQVDPTPDRGNNRETLRRPGADGGLHPVDPGTVAHATLKNAARRILSGPDLQTTARGAFLAGVFGPDTVASGRGGQGTPSKVWVNEPAITGASTVTMPRVSLEPLTQGVAAGPFFDTVLTAGGSDWEITVLDPTDAQAGLIWFLLRDLEDGTAPPTGSGGSIGHGRRVLTVTGISINNTPTTGPWRKDATILTHIRAFDEETHRHDVPAGPRSQA